MPATITAPAAAEPVHTCQVAVCQRARLAAELPGWKHLTYHGFHQFTRGVTTVVLDCRRPEATVLTMPGGVNLPVDWGRIKALAS